MAAPGLEIKPLGPFSWPAALDVLGNFRPTSHHPQDQEGTLRLTFPLDGDFTPVAVALRSRSESLVGEVVGTDRLDAVTAQVARIFSLDHDGTAYPEVAERDPALAPLMNALTGLRPVCFTSPYETAVWGVMSQRISARQAAGAQQWLVSERGERLRIDGGELACFPRPERLLDLESVPGLSAEKVQRLRSVAQAALDGKLDAARLRDLGNEAAPASLREIPGIGDFWSMGIYLRGCGIVDVFPDEPLAIAALGNLHGLGDRPDALVVRQLTDLYRPFRMWVCFLLRVAGGRPGLIEGMGGREGAIRRGSRRPRTG